MRVSILLLTLTVLIVSQTVLADDNLGKAQAIIRIVTLGGTVEQAGNATTIVLIGCDRLKDDDLPIILKPFPNLVNLYLGNTAISDSGLKHLTACKELRSLGLIGTKVTDAGLKHLESLDKLEELRLSGNAIADPGLKSLGKLTNLQTLLLGSTEITDEGLKEFRKLQKLTELDISDTKVTDVGLMELSQLKHLKVVTTMAANVTPDGEKRLRELLPEVQVSGQEAGQSMGQRPDPDFDVSIAKPAYPDKHPSVLFDEAHNNFHTASGRYKVFADLITNDGYRVIPGQGTFTLKRLADYQILVIANACTESEQPTSAFTKDECDAVEEWVKAGGSLLLVTDHEPFGSGSSDLAKRFGVDMSLRVTTDPANETERGLLFSRKQKQIGEHPIMSGRNESERVDRVLTFTGQSLKGPPGSTALLKFADTAVERKANEEETSATGQIGTILQVLFGGQSQQSNLISAASRAQGVALDYGSGRVVVMGEAAQLSAQIYGFPPQQMGMNVPGCDNRQMVLNLVHWLSHLGDSATTNAP